MAENLDETLPWSAAADGCAAPAPDATPAPVASVGAASTPDPVAPVGDVTPPPPRLPATGGGAIGWAALVAAGALVLRRRDPGVDR